MWFSTFVCRFSYVFAYIHSLLFVCLFFYSLIFEKLSSFCYALISVWSFMIIYTFYCYARFQTTSLIYCTRYETFSWISKTKIQSLSSTVTIGIIMIKKFALRILTAFLTYFDYFVTKYILEVPYPLKFKRKKSYSIAIDKIRPITGIQIKQRINSNWRNHSMSVVK